MTGKKSLGLMEQILYGWLSKQLAGVKNREKIGGLEYSLYIKQLSMVIMICNSSTISVNDLKRVQAAKDQKLTLLRVVNDKDTERAVLEEDSEMGYHSIIFNLEYDPYLITQVMPLVQYFIEEKYGIQLSIDIVDEGMILRAIGSVYKVGFSDSFAANYRELTKFWDTEGNYGLKPEQISKDCNQLFRFKCPRCNKIFVSSIENLVDSGCCTCCGKNLLFNEDECTVRLDEMTGKHNKIGCFIINDNKTECGYKDLIFTTLQAAIQQGRVKELLAEGVIFNLNSRRNASYHIGIYGFEIGNSLEEQYNLLMEIMSILNLDYSNIYVQLKEIESKIVDFGEKLVDVERELESTGVVVENDGTIYIESSYDRSSRKQNVIIEQVDILRNSFSNMELDILMRQQYSSSYDYQMAKFYLGIPDNLNV